MRGITSCRYDSPITLVEVRNIEESSSRLRATSGMVYLVNAPGTIAFFGVRGVHYIFSQLKQNFTNIASTILRVEDQVPAFFTAVALGYSRLIYTGSSKTIAQIAAAHGVELYASENDIIPAITSNK